MMTILTMTLIGFANSLISSLFVLFVLPKRKKGMRNLTVIPFSFVLNILYFYAVYKEYFLLSLILEYIILITPIVIYCTGDIWRSLLIRLVYQLGANLVTNIRIPLKLFRDEEKEYLMTKVSSNVAFGIYTLLIFSFSIIVTILIIKPVIKRWSPEHKKIYTVITIFILAMGFINGFYRVILLSKENYGSTQRANDFWNIALMITYCIITVTVIASNFIYDRYVNEAIKKENEEISERLRNNEISLESRDSFKKYMDEKVSEMQNDGIMFNYVSTGRFDMTDTLKKIIQLIMCFEKQKEAKNVDLRLTEQHEMIIILFSDDSEQKIVDSEDYLNLKKLVTEAGGTVENDNEIVIFLPYPTIPGERK